MRVKDKRTNRVRHNSCLRLRFPEYDTRTTGGRYLKNHAKVWKII